MCVFTACGGVLEHGMVRLHKSVQKVQTHVLQPAHDQADGMKKCVNILTQYTMLHSFKTHDITTRPAASKP